MKGERLGEEQTWGMYKTANPSGLLLYVIKAMGEEGAKNYSTE